MEKRIVRRAKVDDRHLNPSLHPVIRQIYASRGVKNDHELELKLINLIKAQALLGVELACEILYQALEQGKKVVIIGDFDADGATSTALMMEALSLFGCHNHSFLVPNRFEYGYGLSPEIAADAIAQGAELIITVDSGISCHRGVDFAKQQGCQVIITDHHMPGATLPNADAIINPNQHQCSFASKSLAGVGVAFYFMMAMRQYLRAKNWFYNQEFAEPNLAQLLDLVALGTVADVVSLDYNNRILVAQGIQRMRSGLARPGILALVEVAGRDMSQLQASDLGFVVGPRINAAGRLEDMSFGIHCLLSKDSFTAKRMAQELDTLNKARREIEQGIQAEAESILNKLLVNSNDLPNGIALFQPDWHQGVIGIVAGRIKEKFNRPTVVFASAVDGCNMSEESEIKGSARSIAGVHIRDLLDAIDKKHPDLIIKFGGHAMAAGLSIKASNFSQFKQVFELEVKNWVNAELLQGIILSDGGLTSSQLNMDFAFFVKNAGPWGQNFTEPLFDDEFELIQQRLVGERHLKLVLQKDGILYDAIAFNINLRQWPNTKATKAHIAYQLDINEFRGNRTLQLLVNEIKPI